MLVNDLSEHDINQIFTSILSLNPLLETIKAIEDILHCPSERYKAYQPGNESIGLELKFDQNRYMAKFKEYQFIIDRLVWYENKGLSIKARFVSKRAWWHPLLRNQCADLIKTL